MSQILNSSVIILILRKVQPYTVFLSLVGGLSKFALIIIPSEGCTLVRTGIYFHFPENGNNIHSFFYLLTRSARI